MRKDNYERADKNESRMESEDEKKKRLHEAWYQFNRCCYGKTGPNQCKMVGTFQLTPESFICSWHHGLSSDKNNLGEFKKWTALSRGYEQASCGAEGPDEEEKQDDAYFKEAVRRENVGE